MSGNRDVRRRVREIADHAKRQGWRVERSGHEHFKFYAPNGRDIVVTGRTSRSVSGLKNFLSVMRRAGYQEE